MSERYSIPERINILRQALSSDKGKVAFLLGAGCPLSIMGDNNKPIIPSLAGLTDTICSQSNSEKINSLREGIDLAKGKNVSIEDILSRVRLLIEAIGKSEFEGFKKKELEKIEKEICNRISKEVDKELSDSPNKNTSYHKLASWISGMQRENPVEIFTLNYDLLMESALEANSVPYFDGFTGVRDAFFDLQAMEHEKLPPRWARLWKLHGSVNWWMDKKNNIFRGNDKKAGYRQMIYPSHLKYSQSRRMPYLAMQDRLSNFLSDGQSILITCGYSFSDQHLNEVIRQRLSANPRSICFGLLYDEIKKYPEALECAESRTNFHLLAKDAVFFAKEQKNWRDSDDNTYWYLSEKTDGITTCKIGDFEFLSQFLNEQTGHS